MDTRLLQRYITGDATEAERRQVMEWIDESPEHLREYMAQRKLYEFVLWNSAAKEEAGRRMLGKKPVWELLKIAAVVAIVFLGSHYWQGKQDLPDVSQSVYVPAGQRAELILADGTKVWLNSRSRLVFPATFNEDVRTVKLDGEGYFMVKADASHPFVVTTSKADVRVLGTEFNVIAYASDSIWETSLLKGKVEVLTQDSDLVLEPDTRVILQGGKLMKVPIEEMDYFRWREGLICFNNISLENMMKKLELYYGVKIVVNNRAILHNHYTGKFRTNDGIEHVLRVLKLNNHFTYTKDDKTNIITIN